jgi:hypothetical protein
MIENGELEYSLEEDPEYETEETDTSPIEIIFESSMPLPIPNDDSSSSTDSTRKRGAPDSPHEEDECHVAKKPKLTEIEPEVPSLPAVEVSTTEQNPIPMAVDKTAAVSEQVVVEEKKEEIKVEPKPKAATPNKTPSRGRGTPYVATTPLAVVTRTRALSASTAGAEIIVPEQSLSVPKFMPKAPIRAIEIPTWNVRASYELEEDIRTDYQSFRSNNKSSGSSSTSTLTSISELEKKFYRACDAEIAAELITHPRNHRCEAHQNATTSSCAKCRTDPNEETDDDASYAVRHYKKEIIERLGWDVGPGPKRFKKDDKDMSVDDFKSSTLWPTYFTTHKGKLLPKDLWAQNMAPERKPRHHHVEHHAGPGRPRTRTPKQTASVPRAPPPVIVPKGFVLKIRSAAGLTVVKGGNVTPLPTGLVRRPGGTPAQTTTPKKPIVKKSAGVIPSSTNGSAPPAGQISSAMPVPKVISTPSKPSQSTSNTVIPPVTTAVPPVILSRGPAKLVVKMGSKTFTPAPAQPTAPQATAANGGEIKPTTIPTPQESTQPSQNLIPAPQPVPNPDSTVK